MGNGFTELGCDGELPGLGDECTTDEANGAWVDGAGLGEHGAPPASRQRQPAQTIDHRAQHIDGVDGCSSGDYWRHGLQQIGFGQLDVVRQRLPLGQPPDVGDVSEHWEHATAGDQLRGVPVDGTEPGDRCTEIGAQRIELAERGKRARIQPLAHDVGATVGQVERHHAGGTVVRHARAPRDTGHLVVQVAAVDTAARLPGDGFTIDPAQL